MTDTTTPPAGDDADEAFTSLALRDRLFQMSESCDPSVRARAKRLAAEYGVDIIALSHITYQVEVTVELPVDRRMTEDLAMKLTNLMHVTVTGAQQVTSRVVAATVL